MIDLQKVTSPIKHLFQDHSKAEGGSDEYNSGLAIGFNNGYNQAITNILNLLKRYDKQKVPTERKRS